MSEHHSSFCETPKQAFQQTNSTGYRKGRILSLFSILTIQYSNVLHIKCYLIVKQYDSVTLWFSFSCIVQVQESMLGGTVFTQHADNCQSDNFVMQVILFQM